MAGDRLMQIKIINGNTSEAMTRGIDQVAQTICSSQTTLVTVQPRTGP